MKSILLFLTLTIYSCSGTQEIASKKKDFYFIPTIHQLHKVNENYNYDSVSSIIKRIDPDIIAIEIRDIDIDEDTTILAKTYPNEFVAIKKNFRDKKIVGFDWWEEGVEKVKASDLPKNYFTDLPIKILWKSLEKDSINLQRVNECLDLQKERIELLKNLSLSQLLESKDGELVQQYYQCLKEKLKDTPYYPVVEASEQRDKNILKNINHIIANNKGKRIVVLTGDDHFQMLRDKFRN